MSLESAVLVGVCFVWDFLVIRADKINLILLLVVLTIESVTSLF